MGDESSGVVCEVHKQKIYQKMQSNKISSKKYYSWKEFQ